MLCVHNPGPWECLNQRDSASKMLQSKLYMPQSINIFDSLLMSCRLAFKDLDTVINVDIIVEIRITFLRMSIYRPWSRMERFSLHYALHAVLSYATSD